MRKVKIQIVADLAQACADSVMYLAGYDSAALHAADSVRCAAAGYCNAAVNAAVWAAGAAVNAAACAAANATDIKGIPRSDTSDNAQAAYEAATIKKVAELEDIFRRIVLGFGPDGRCA